MRALRSSYRAPLSFPLLSLFSHLFFPGFLPRPSRLLASLGLVAAGVSTYRSHLAAEQDEEKVTDLLPPVKAEETPEHFDFVCIGAGMSTYMAVKVR